MEQAIRDMLEDIGFRDPEVREASSTFAARVFNECPGISADDVQCEVVAYGQGYADALQRAR